MRRQIPLRNLPQFPEVRQKIQRLLILSACVLIICAGIGVVIALSSSVSREIHVTDAAGEVIGTYVGRVSGDGIPHGKGELTLTDGTVCRGRFDTGKPTGVMECTFPIGSHYKGMLSDDFRPMGEGTYTYVNEETFTAEDWEWVENATIDGTFISYTGMGLSSGQMYGYGIRVDAEDKESYEVAEFKNAVPHGVYQLGMSGQYQLLWIFENGKCISDDKTLFIYINNESEPVQGLYENWENKTLTDGSYAGCTYYGHVIGGQIVYGLLIFPDGSEYLGLFVDGKIYAKSAEFTYHDGEKRMLENVRWVEEEKILSTNGNTFLYTGMTAGGKENGYGTSCLMNSAQTFVGTFLDGKAYYGTMAAEDNSIFVGMFLDGTIHEGTVTFSDGSEYTGAFRDHSAHGEGILKTAEGHTFRGTFEKGKPKKGTWTYADGTVKEIQY